MDNYFDFFGIPEAFEIDLTELRKRYIQNSKKYHPDFHTLSNAIHQENILEKSTLNNKAWKTLSDRSKRIEHLLRIHDAMPEEGKASVPQEFLMDMMDINEALMELKFEPDPEKTSDVQGQLDKLTNEIEEAGKTAMNRWDEGRDNEVLTEVRDYFLKLKYINRIKEQLQD